jgi:parvulin-like peptidyl-prolyl isomerase
MKILAQVKQFPAQFAALAKKHSDDGSSSSGGDLGYLTQGETIKELDEAIFKMKQGEIRGPVRSPIGYHILQVTAVKQPPSFAKSKFRLAYRFQMMELQKLMKKEAKELREGADIKILVPWGR